MLRRCLAAFCVLLVVAGCGAVRRVDPTADSAAVANINARTAFGIVEVELVGGERLDVTRLRIEGDTATWRKLGRPQEIAAVPVSDIRAIRVPAVGGGVGRTLAGVSLGLVGGALLGLATAPVPDPEEGGEAFIIDFALLPARTVLPALLGGLVGGIVGASTQPKDVFKFTGSMDSAGSMQDTTDTEPRD